jgi:hypothetical protein
MKTPSAIVMSSAKAPGLARAMAVTAKSGLVFTTMLLIVEEAAEASNLASAAEGSRAKVGERACQGAAPMNASAGMQALRKNVGSAGALLPMQEERWINSRR